MGGIQLRFSPLASALLMEVNSLASFWCPGGPAWHPMDIPWHHFGTPGRPFAPHGHPLAATFGLTWHPFAPHGYPLAATLALLCKRLKHNQKDHYFELHFWCVFGKGVHAIRPRRRSPNPHFAHFAALHFKTSKKAKDRNALWTRGEGILDTS